MPEQIEELASLTSLGLGWCRRLADISALSGLTGLTSLDLSGCKQLENISALTGLTGLTSLDLGGCDRLADISSLSELTNLTLLNLHGCPSLRSFSSVRPLLDQLDQLYLQGCHFDDLDEGVYGGELENVRDEVRAHYADADFAAGDDDVVKLFLLGNGGAGKTQLRRRLCGKAFDPSIESTHGVEIERFPLSVDDTRSVHLGIWDFGGQDVYHGTHALFLQKHALYVILWHPEMETGAVVHDGLAMRNRPLAYWLDFVRSVAGVDAPVIIVQSHFDDPTAELGRVEQDAYADFKRAYVIQASSKKGDGLDRLKPYLKSALEYLIKVRPPLKIGAGRVRVRDRLRDWLAADQDRKPAEGEYRTVPWARFVELCEAGRGDVSDPKALADYLHRTGFLFYRPGLFRGEILLDQGWALEAIYAVLHRDRCVNRLRRSGGRFTCDDLGIWLWDEKGHSLGDQARFIDMMLGCGICFRFRMTGPTHDREWEYVAPDHLPTLAQFQLNNPNIRLRDPGSAEVAARVEFRFLHDGLLRSLLAMLGEASGDTADYWRYGCCFRDPEADTVVRLDSTITPDGPSAAGTIVFSAWGEKGRIIIEELLRRVETLSPGQAIRPAWTDLRAGKPRRPGTPRRGKQAGDREAIPRKKRGDVVVSESGPTSEGRARSDARLLHDAVADLTEGQLAQIAQELGINSADLPRGDHRLRAVEIVRQAGRDQTGRKIDQLINRVLDFNPDAQL
ncbi:COR domain-containing protein [Isosphaeraceae bacterium EP7]